MQRFISLLTLFTLFTAYSFAQNLSIAGRVTDSESKEMLVKVAVQVYRPDSTYLTGVTTDSLGRFTAPIPQPGKYLIKFSTLGYKQLWQPLAMGTQPVSLGDIRLVQDAIMLAETVVQANIPKMVIKGDTTVYNADAYRVPEGSTLEALVERLPGARIEDNGTITINGKTVTKVMLDDRQFMGNTQTAMKNIPTYIVDKVKAYDEKSDMARRTGIDDGNDQTVLNFTVKPKMRKGYIVNADLGYGTHRRYGSNLFSSTFYGKLRYNLIGNANNVSDRGFNGRRGRGGGSGSGQHTNRNVGLGLSYFERNKLRVNGNITWNHGNNENESRTSAENFVNKRGAFSNSHNLSHGRNEGISANAQLEWQIDTLTTLNLRPNFSYSFNDGRSRSNNASFQQDPYKFTDDPLAATGLAQLAADSVIVNSRANKSNNWSSSTSVGTSFNLFRRLSRNGRNFTIGGNFNKSDSRSKNISASNVHLYLVKDQLGNDSTYQTNRYTMAPSHSLSYSLNASYSEPLMKNLFLQLHYNFAYSHDKRDPATYDFDDTSEEIFLNTLNGYRGWDAYFDYLSFPLDHYLDSDLSRYSEHTNYNHDINTQLRLVTNHFNVNMGMQVRPQRSYFKQDYMGLFVDTVRNVTNISPTLHLQYRAKRANGGQTRLEANYRGSTSQPSITDLLDIRDDSNPLYIRMGNPGLLPAFTHNASLNFNNNNIKYHTNVNANMNFGLTRNSISNVVTYDESTGGRTTRPENINGDWYIGGGVTFNTALDTMNVWNVSARSSVNYNQNAGYVTLGQHASSQKNYARTTTYREDLSAEYRNDWLEVELQGAVNYQHARNMLQPQSNLDTWRYSYGASLSVQAPWGMQVATDINMHSRRGYNDANMNTNELIWNAQIAQSFLRGKALTVRLQLYDILARQSNFARNINANSRQDTWTNAINSYAMLHVSYRLHVFGSRQARREMRNGMRNFNPDDRQGTPDGARGMGRGGRDRGTRGGRTPRAGFGGPSAR